MVARKILNADASFIGSLKNQFTADFDKYGVLTTVYDDETSFPKDYRLYLCEAERLYEIGGIEHYLQYAKHAFEKRGMVLSWSNEISKSNGEHWIQTL